MAGREKQVEQMLKTQGISISNLRIEDRDSVISIYGSAGTADAKQRAERVVEDTLKVKVANHINAPADTKAGQASPGSAPQGTVTHEGQRYVVKSGDTLRKIAQRHYGDEMKWPKIRDANREKLPDPDKIQVGMELVIPSGD
jgi:nucleoid-associated protein YgaU